MPNIGLPEMMIVLVIALVILGPKKLPDAGRSLGHGIRSFKDAISGGGNDDDAAVQAAIAPSTSSSTSTT